jgi:hypothetical protein
MCVLFYSYPEWRRRGSVYSVEIDYGVCRDRVEVLYMTYNNISTDFILVLSTNLLMVEVVEIVEVFSPTSSG